MNPKQFKIWKEKQIESAEIITTNLKLSPQSSIKDIYPEFCFDGAYTTSLEPYVPLWALVPFFDKIIITITTSFNTEEEFIKCYGLSVEKILFLFDNNRLNIRLTFPKYQAVLPKYLNPIFEREFPTTVRDHLFYDSYLSTEAVNALVDRFDYYYQNSKSTKSSSSLADMDRIIGDEHRAYLTSRTAYIQLAVVGASEQMHVFESLLQRDMQRALNWLNLCRLFLVGPEHYSMGGIHSVADIAINNNTTTTKSNVFPSELGMRLVDVYKLFRPKYKVTNYNIEDTIDIYQNTKLARDTLFALSKAIESNDNLKHNLENVQSLIKSASKEEELLLRGLRIMASVGISISMAPFDPIAGILAGAGFAVASESPLKPVDKILSPALNKLSSNRKNDALALLLKLDQDVKDSFQE